MSANQVPKGTQELLFFTGMCTFEKDKCGFVDDATGKFNWTRHQGSTGSFGTGPRNDHTKGTAAGILPNLHLTRS